MTDSCKVCGKTSSLMNCKRCKSVAYCSADCQRQDWKTHKPVCQRKEFAGAPCDCCGSTENVDTRGASICTNCGFIYCEVCDEQTVTRNLAGELVSVAPCPRCHQRQDPLCVRDYQKLEKLIKESPRDPRVARWLIHLGKLVLHFDDSRRGEEKAKEHFLRAGELGLGEGFSRVAIIYIKNRNWDEARRYYRKGADLMHVISIGNLASEASLGYFELGQIIQEDHRRPPNWEEAFRLYREGARLGHAGCCARLGLCYLEGEGIVENLVKGFKWSKKAAEKGDTQGMRQCSRCCLLGQGVDQSNEQAIYWLEKCSELEDDESLRDALSVLRGLSTGTP